MRISELSDDTGVPVATIKYYLREGLLPAGHRTSANQATYDASHAERLRLIRALIDVGNLPVATAREVIAAIDSPELPLTWVFGVAQHAISDAGLYAPVDADSAGMAAVDEFLERSGWHVSEQNPGRYGAARVIDTYHRIGHSELADISEGYAAGSELIARADLNFVAQSAEVTSMAETVVVGTVLGDALLSSLRRMAQEHVSQQVFPAAPDQGVPNVDR